MTTMKKDQACCWSKVSLSLTFSPFLFSYDSKSTENSPCVPYSFQESNTSPTLAQKSSYCSNNVGGPDLSPREPKKKDKTRGLDGIEFSDPIMLTNTKNP
jgi:hypothetical protein